MPGSDCGEISPFPLSLLSGIILALCTTPLELSRLVCFSERRRGEGCHGNWTDLSMHFVAWVARGGGMGVAEIEGDKVSSPAVRPSVGRTRMLSCHAPPPLFSRRCCPPPRPRPRCMRARRRAGTFQKATHTSGVSRSFVLSASILSIPGPCSSIVGFEAYSTSSC